MNAMPPPDIATVASIRARLWDAGYRPVALKTADKMPTTAKWQDRARRDPPADAEDAPTTDRLNTGILCDGLRVIDLDIDDPVLAHRLRALAGAMLGETLSRTRQRTGRSALIYRAAEGEPGKRALAGKVGKIEVLGRGQQLHAYGPHPSGTGLTWTPEPPDMTSVTTLPAVTEAQLGAFLSACAPLIQAEQPQQAKAAGSYTGPANEEALMADISSGASFHEPVVKLAGKWAMEGVPLMAARERLLAAFDAVPDATRDERWRQRRADVERCLLDIYGKDAGGQPELAVWPRISPAAASTDSLPPPVLPLRDVFPPRVASWIKDAAESKGAPADFVAVTLLTVVGGIIGNARWANPWEGWEEPPVINTALVGPPSSGKSPAQDAATAPLLEIAAEENGDWKERKREHATEKAAAAERRAAWQADVKQAVAGKHAPPTMPTSAEEPDMPQKRRIYSTDPTVAKAERLSAANPRGLVLHRDELAGWVAGMDRFSNGGGSDRAFWLQSYGGRMWTPDRVKDGDAEVMVPHLTWAITGGIQPDRLNTLLLAGDDDGLAARFLYTWPAPLRPRRPRDRVERRARDAVAQEVARAVLAAARADPGALYPRRARRSARVARGGCGDGG